MFGSIKYNLSHLLDFTGRDARQTFWYYVLFLAVMKFAAGMAIAIPLMVNMFAQLFNAAKSGVTDQQAINDLMASQMGSWMQTTVPVSIVLGLVVMALFVAAFVRRLHDSDKPGWWVALPVVTQLIALGVSYSSLGKMQDYVTSAMQHPGTVDALQYQRDMAGLSLIGWIGYIAVIVFGVLKSTEGPNRYGDAPVRF